MQKKYGLGLLLVLLLLAAFCQLYRINRGFDGLHEYDAAQHSLYARNILEHRTFGPVANINPLNGRFSYYLYHPFLAVYIYALFFKLFGGSIIAGRLISMFFFACGAVIFFFLARAAANQKIAFWALFFYLFFPISQYFGKFVSAGNIDPPLILLFLLAYLLWLKRNEKKYLLLMALALFLGCLVDWYAYFLVPLTALHYYLFIKKRNNPALPLSLVAVFCLLLYLLVNYLLTGSFFASQSQWPPGLGASSGIENTGVVEHALRARMDFTLLFNSSFYVAIYEHLVNSFTFLILGLIIFFAFNLKRLPSYHQILFFPAAIYLFQGLLQPKTLSDHITLTTLLSPTVAFAAGTAIEEWHRSWKTLFAAAFIVLAGFGTLNLYSMNNTNQNDLMIGRIVPLVTNPQDGIALSQPYFSPFIEYYGKRSLLYDVFDADRINFVSNSKKIKYFVTNRRDFQNYLLKDHPAVFLPNGFAFFDISSPPSFPAEQYRIRFDNNIALVGHSIRRLTGNYLLASYRWEKKGGRSNPFEVFVHFESDNGKYLFGQDHFIKNGLVDLSSSSPQKIEESYLIPVPDTSRQSLNVFIGIYSPASWQRFKVLDPRANDNRFPLGRIALDNQ